MYSCVSDAVRKWYSVTVWPLWSSIRNQCSQSVRSVSRHTNTCSVSNMTQDFLACFEHSILCWRSEVCCSPQTIQRSHPQEVQGNATQRAVRLQRQRYEIRTTSKEQISCQYSRGGHWHHVMSHDGRSIRLMFSIIQNRNWWNDVWEVLHCISQRYINDSKSRQCGFHTTGVIYISM